MANSILTTVYNQYLTTYAPKKSDTRYDLHKRSELKSICNSMAKVNRDAPLYMLENSENTRQFVVELKEEARELQNTIIALSSDADSIDFNGKVAYSSDENIISAKYIGNATPALEDAENENSEDGKVISPGGEIPTFEISVEALASPQVNLGKFLPKDEKNISPGEYAFDLTVNGQGYEFQYSINSSDTNEDIQNRLSRLINNSNIGLSASVEEDEDGNTALRIESNRIGIDFGQSSQIFTFNDTNNNGFNGSVSYLGIDHVAREASNAHFTVNGTEATAGSNSFILQKQYEITLNGISPNEGQTVTVGVKPDTEGMRDNISNLLGGYNQFIRSIEAYKDSQSRSSALVQEMGKITRAFGEDLKQLGVSRDSDGTLSLNAEEFDKLVSPENAKEKLAPLKDFSSAMLRKSKQISLNPISYMNKTVVAYKNPGHNHFTPYVSSAYAGLLFNSYC